MHVMRTITIITTDMTHHYMDVCVSEPQIDDDGDEDQK